MNRYLDHMHTKPTHERRRHAMRIAGIVTVLVFVGWVTTLGLQLGSSSTNASQTAAAVTSSYDATQTSNQLIVSTSTTY
jgi:hypothetical protein